ncbi:SGNH hydrolase, partial [Aureobasidium melanogenum]
MASNSNWTSFAPNATEISYKGRWDTNHISWWLAPGLKFGFTGDKSQRPQTFELRVTNYAYGVQIAGIHLSKDAKLIKIPNFPKKIEVIGDSLSVGQYGTFEGLSSYAWGLAEGLGNVETPDTSSRAEAIHGDNPPLWDFAHHQRSDIVIINLGTNDNNTHNNVTSEKYLSSYIEFVGQVHHKYLRAQIILISLWNGFNQVGNTWQQGGAFIEEIQQVYAHYNDSGFVHYFNTTAMGPLYHPTDVGYIKLASHLMQYIKLKVDWVFEATGPEVQADTLYWNDEPNY